ncbi:MAG: FMN-binding protein [Treponema sp.]|jgi:fumarate reductase flavoprotein subunit|nr:FMN-binding protein [Treponema sp.]
MLLLFLEACDNATNTPEEPYTLHFSPGTYTDSAIGFNSQNPITVRVTFSEDAIESIEIVSHGESVDHEDFGDKIQATLDLIPPAIIEKQTLALDAVSGATASFSRRGILKAVEDCVKQAGGDEAVAKLKEGGLKSVFFSYF